MRTSTIAVVLLAALGLGGVDAQNSRFAGLQKPLQQIRSALPKSADAMAIPAAAPSSDSGPLPQPSLTEPFAIGEGFYVEGNLANAVVSMLALMRIAIVPDADSSRAAGPAGSGLALSESEVRALIDMGRQDLESSDDIENLPHSFADLHAAVADLLPGVSIEQLAEIYTRAYEASPDDLVAKALMGQPLEPGTKLTRTQIWFLLMDGFAGAGANGVRWGTADRQLPDLVSPNPQWSAAEFREVLARLPLVTADRLVTVAAPAVITPGAAANAAPADVAVRVNASAAPLVSRSTGRTLIAARAGSLAGQDVTWRVRDDSLLEEIGKISSPVDDPVRVGGDGVAHFVFQPGSDPTRGAGQVVEDWETVEARFQTRGLVAGAYAVPPQMARLTLGTSRARANLHLRWRSSDVMYLAIYNAYSGINFEIPGTGTGATRNGLDKLTGMLFKRRDGSYAGRALVEVSTDQVLRGPTTCPTAAMNVSQIVHVKATPEQRFGPVHRLEDYVWLDNQVNLTVSMDAAPPDGGYYQIRLLPVTQPNIARPSPCLPFIPATPEQLGFGATDFIPLNDAQWTTPGQGYGIALKARGRTQYADGSSVDPLAGTPLEKLKTAFQLTGTSVWVVLAGRTMQEFLGQ